MLKFLEKKRWLSWLGVFIFALIIFYFSSLTGKQTPSLGFDFSSFYHFLVFFWLAFFLLLALVQGKRKNLFFIAVILALIYAVSDEFHQLFIPGRASSFLDFLTDSAGIFLSSFIYSLSLIRKKK